MKKDKLYKYHHKKAFYVLRKSVFIFVIGLISSIAVAIPTTINLLQKDPTIGFAQENQTEDNDNEIDNILLDYQNNSSLD